MTASLDAPGGAAVHTVRVPVLPKQLDFIRARESQVLYSGAFGAGKSRALCLKLVHNASAPGSVHGLFRKTRASLVRTTLRTLIYPEADLPPVLPLGTYTHNETKGEITIHGGGVIMYAGCDQPTVLGSMNLVTAAVDEAIELDEDEWTMIRGRLRMKTAGKNYVRQVYASTNPGAPAHFLHKLFFGAPHPRRRVITAKTTDNKFLPLDFLEAMNELTGTRRQRFVEGLWVAFEGLVYGDQWDREKHIRGPAAAAVTSVVGCDVGYTNPTAFVRMDVDGDGRVHCAAEFYKRRVLQADAVRVALDFAPLAVWVVDPSAAGFIAALRNAGLSVVEADNDVQAGIARVQDRLAVQGDGNPRLTVAPDCENVVMEFESYAWHKDKDQPVKELDHALDGIRYGIAYLDAGRIRPTTYGGEDQADAVPARKPGEDLTAELVEDDRMWDQ